MPSDDPFEGWAILELMGHRRLAGYVRAQEIAGAGMLRLDVHGTCRCKDCGPACLSGCSCEVKCDCGDAVVTQFYSPSALYCLTPTTEEIARKLGERLRPAPVTRYELDPPKPRSYDDGHDDPDDYEDAAGVVRSAPF